MRHNVPRIMWRNMRRITRAQFVEQYVRYALDSPLWRGCTYYVRAVAARAIQQTVERKSSRFSLGTAFATLNSAASE